MNFVATISMQKTLTDSTLFLRPGKHFNGSFLLHLTDLLDGITMIYKVPG